MDETGYSAEILYYLVHQADGPIGTTQPTDEAVRKQMSMPEALIHLKGHWFGQWYLSFRCNCLQDAEGAANLQTARQVVPQARLIDLN